MPTWTTPIAIHSKCGESSSFPATYSIDNIEWTYWSHLFDELHWVKYDLGQTYTITKIRVLPGIVNWNSFEVYVSNDPNNWGTAVATGCSATVDIWNEITCTEKDGRYVYLKDIDPLHITNYLRLYEFDAYCAPLAKLGSDLGSGADAASEFIATLTKSDQGAGTDILSALINILHKTDTCAGTDALSELLAAVIQSDSGSGNESLCSRLLGSSDQGAGADSLSELIATILKTDSGSGIEATKVVYIFMLLKVLHERQVNIMASQSDRPVNITLSQEVIKN